MPRQPKKPTKKPNKNNKPVKTRSAYVYGPVAPVFNSVNTGSWRIVRPDIDNIRCIGCGQCETFCPTGVIEIKDDEKQPSGKIVVIDWTYCKGCGICANVCPKECIKMVDEKEEK